MIVKNLEAWATANRDASHGSVQLAKIQSRPRTRSPRSSPSLRQFEVVRLYPLETYRTRARAAIARLQDAAALPANPAPRCDM
jgi:hypothetical protein